MLTSINFLINIKEQKPIKLNYFLKDDCILTYQQSNVYKHVALKVKICGLRCSFHPKKCFNDFFISILVKNVQLLVVNYCLFYEAFSQRLHFRLMIFLKNLYGFKNFLITFSKCTIYKKKTDLNTK